MKDKKIDLFLDSGAFSAFTQNVEINIHDYIDFIKKHEGNLQVYANLDVIGSPEGTWKNQRIMERAGLNPLPCFHFGEDPKWLNRYLKKGYEYIALGGMAAGKSGAPLPTRQRMKWLDEIWQDHLTLPDGMPKVKVHGFGMTSLRLMLRYPWFSVDSTSWVVTGRMGSVYIPRLKGGEWVYDKDSLKIDVSSKSPQNNNKGKHITNMPPTIQNTLMNYITHKGYVLGKSEFKEVDLDYELEDNEKWAESKKDSEVRGRRAVEIIVEHGICNDYRLRDELNIIYFLDLEKSMQKWPWPLSINKRQTGFII